LLRHRLLAAWHLGQDGVPLNEAIGSVGSGGGRGRSARIAAGTAGHPDENGFTYGLLYARELDRAEHSRRLAHHWAPKAATG